MLLTSSSPSRSRKHSRLLSLVIGIALPTLYVQYSAAQTVDTDLNRVLWTAAHRKESLDFPGHISPEYLVSAVCYDDDQRISTFGGQIECSEQDKGALHVQEEFFDQEEELEACQRYWGMVSSLRMQHPDSQ